MESRKGWKTGEGHSFFEPFEREGHGKTIREKEGRSQEIRQHNRKEMLVIEEIGDSSKSD